MFRPCIDLHQGKVKQIVGSTLREGDASPTVNFESERPASYYAALYRDDGLMGGHVIMLGPGNEAAARDALGAFPGGLQIGGGITPRNATAWLDAGASHAIVTSYVFHGGQVDVDRLQEMVRTVGQSRLVLDLSCRKREGVYYVVADRWQSFTQTPVRRDTLEMLAEFADEFLVHAADVEGMQKGIDEELVGLLGASSPIPATYAGGARQVEDLERVWRIGGGRVNLTIGSALDIFGGSISYREVVALDRRLQGREAP
jgi:phosphoribosylformimino-5-aminoimidazole carboxamide ribotide isomerase